MNSQPTTATETDYGMTHLLITGKLEEGYNEGLSAGKKAGMEIGKKAGMEAGMEIGLETRRKEGVAQAVRIMSEIGITKEVLADKFKLTVSEIEAIIKA